MASSPDVYILGIGNSHVGRYPNSSFTELCRQAVSAAAADAFLTDGPLPAEMVWFGNFMMDSWGQRAVRGQEALMPLMEEGILQLGATVINVEDACASGSVAFNGALTYISSGRGDVALAVGVEKMNSSSADPVERKKFMANGLAAGQGVLSDSFWDPFRKLATKNGLEFSTSPDRSFAMDIYALWTKDYMATYGTTIEQIAQVAVKNHNNGALNDRAQYRFTTTLDEVMQDRVVASPLTRAMCAPSTDGAAAALVCSEEFLRRQPAAVQRRAVRVLGQGIAGGVRYASWGDERAPVRAAASAFQQAGISVADIDVVELHDASAFAEIHLIEDIGLCGRGEGGPLTMSGATEIGGDIAVSPSGGLLSRGHPIGATGLLMLREITDQLRGEAGAYQVPGAKIGLAENGGGFAGTDVAVCSVTILARA